MNPPTESPATSFRYSWALAVEGSLLALALALSLVFGRRLWVDLDFSGLAWLQGVAATGPLFGLLGWLTYTEWEPLAEIRRFLERHLFAAMSHWSVAQLLGLSVVAGVAEETLFRDFIQGKMADVAGPVVGLLIGSLLFGLCHAITRAYFVIASIIGCYLGLLWLWTGTLVVPILAHALYDFIALVYLVHYRPRFEGVNQERKE
jgi:membrane protease YdiL (CAAX protease family)